MPTEGARGLTIIVTLYIKSSTTVTHSCCHIHIIFFPNYVVITISYVVLTTSFLVITRSYVVLTTYFLVITRSYVVLTTSFSRNNEILCR